MTAQCPTSLTLATDDQLAEMASRREDDAISNAKEAFMHLQSRHERAIKAFVASRLLNRHDADDVVQDVWMLAWEKLPTLFAGGSFRAWAFQIGANRCIDHCKKKRPDLFPDGCPPQHGDDALGDPTFQAILVREKAARLRHCIEKLPPKQRCIVEATLCGKKTGDAALACGLTSNAASKAKYEACTVLAACVEGSRS